MQVRKHIVKGIIGILFLSGTVTAQVKQDTVKLNVEELFQLVIKNNPTLRISMEEIKVAEQATKVAKNNLLPSANVSTAVMYLGDVDLFSTNFKTHNKQDMPHFGHNIGIEANQLIWKGGQVRETIKLSQLQEDVASLQYTSTEQQARLSALGYYLDLYKLHNQSRVYQQNIDLAEKRLRNITSFFNQGMVTRNDVIRGELQISNLKLAKLTVDNGILVLNRQLAVALGLPQNTIVQPSEGLLKQEFLVNNETRYQDFALDYNPNVLLTKKSLDIHDSAIAIARKNWYPSLVAFAGNTLQRPVTSSTPARDMYFNTYNAGLSLGFDLGSIWKNERVVQQRKVEKLKAEAQQKEVEAFIGVAVNAAYVKHNEATVQKTVLHTNRALADENYRIMENKYNNQLAIILDLIDASNAKLDADLQYTNAEINIIYAYYKLLKEVGQI